MLGKMFRICSSLCIQDSQKLAFVCRDVMLGELAVHSSLSSSDSDTHTILQIYGCHLGQGCLTTAAESRHKPRAKRKDIRQLPARPRTWTRSPSSYRTPRSRNRFAASPQYGGRPSVDSMASNEGQLGQVVRMIYV